MTEIESTCRHCGRTIAQQAPGLTWAHVIGPGSRLIRCEPSESGKPYGVEAEPDDGLSATARPYVERARQQLLDAGEDPDRPVFMA